MMMEPINGFRSNRASSFHSEIHLQHGISEQRTHRQQKKTSALLATLTFLFFARPSLNCKSPTMRNHHLCENLKHSSLYDINEVEPAGAWQPVHHFEKAYDSDES